MVWAHIHLNNYTSASYNKWYGVSQLCPLCKSSIDGQFHLILSCPPIVALWGELEPFLSRIHPAAITDEELAFGLPGHSPSIQLRNWLTYLLRECVCHQEIAAYHNHFGPLNAVLLKHTYNARVKKEVCEAYRSLVARGRPDLFQRRYVIGDSFLVAPSADNPLEEQDIPDIFQ